MVGIIYRGGNPFMQALAHQLRQGGEVLEISVNDATQLPPSLPDGLVGVVHDETFDDKVKHYGLPLIPAYRRLRSRGASIQRMAQGIKSMFDLFTSQQMNPLLVVKRLTDHVTNQVTLAGLLETLASAGISGASLVDRAESEDDLSLRAAIAKRDLQPDTVVLLIDHHMTYGQLLVEPKLKAALVCPCCQGLSDPGDGSSYLTVYNAKAGCYDIIEAVVPDNIVAEVATYILQEVSEL